MLPGTLVSKKSGKPFKSGRKVNTIKWTMAVMLIGKERLAYTFEEDDSCVLAESCKPATKAELELHKRHFD